MWLNRANTLGEAEHIVAVGVKLELSGQVAVVYNVKYAVSLSFNLNFTEVEGLCGQFNIKTERNSPTLE